MPGFEVVGEEERRALNELFDVNGGILFAHGFDGLRKGVYRVREFERAFAAKMDVAYAQAVSSGTAALRVALEALGVGPGDEVILPCFTFIATLETVAQTGATPVIVDIDETVNISPKSVAAAVTRRTKVILPVHMMGAPAAMNELMAIATEHQLHVLEDAAQACGGTYLNRPLGTIGHMGAYSFDAGKVIITGEGGMVVTGDEALFRISRAYHDHGHEYSETLGRAEEAAICGGFNYRMTELQGAIGLVQLNKLNMILERQRANKKKLLTFLQDLPLERRRFTDEVGELGDAIVFFLETKDIAARVVAGLKQEGLGTKNVPDAMKWHFAGYWQHMYNKYGWYREDWQTAWRHSADLLERAVAIPVMVQMTEEHIAGIGDRIRKIFGRL